jgi:hypothetical protein
VKRYFINIGFVTLEITESMQFVRHPKIIIEEHLENALRGSKFAVAFSEGIHEKGA